MAENYKLESENTPIEISKPPEDKIATLQPVPQNNDNDGFESEALEKPSSIEKKTETETEANNILISQSEPENKNADATYDRKGNSTDAIEKKTETETEGNNILLSAIQSEHENKNADATYDRKGNSTDAIEKKTETETEGNNILLSAIQSEHENKNADATYDRKGNSTDDLKANNKSSPTAIEKNTEGKNILKSTIKSEPANKNTDASSNKKGNSGKTTQKSPTATICTVESRKTKMKAYKAFKKFVRSESQIPKSIRKKSVKAVVAFDPLEKVSPPNEIDDLPPLKNVIHWQSSPLEYKHYHPLYPSCNKILAMRSDKELLKRHHDNLAHIKASVDNSSPKPYIHLKMKLKKVQMQQGFSKI
jgi:3-dehydroquinate dehydratase